MRPRTALGRGAAALVVVGAGVGIAGASALAGPVRTTTPAPRPLPVTARAATIVCPGPETLLVPEGAEPVAPGGPVSVRGLVAAADTGAVEASLVRLDGAGRPAVLTARGLVAGVGAVTPTGAGAVALLARTPAGAKAPLTGGVQTTLARGGDLRALVGRLCGPATTQSWLVGGGTGQGRRARLLLANPSPAPATVDVRVLTPGGPVDPPNGRGVLVPAASQVALLVDALVPGQVAVAVQVRSREGRVVATLHDSLLRGLVAGGADDVVSGADPATGQVVPGLDIRAGRGTGGESALPADVAAPGAVAVRVAVPGNEDAVVRVRLLGGAGPVELAGGIVDVQAGSVVDVPVTGVPDGSYAALVQADVPVVAGAVVGRSRPGSELAGTQEGVAADVPPAEVAWAAATGPLTATVVPLPVGVPARLVIAAAGEAGALRVTPVTPEGSRGQGELVQVSAGTAVAVELPQRTGGVLLEPQGGPLHAAIALEVPDDAGPLVSILPVTAVPPSAQTRRPVLERPRLGLPAGG